MPPHVGIDLHLRRSVIVRQSPDGELLETVRIHNGPVASACELIRAGDDPEVVIEHVRLGAPRGAVSSGGVQGPTVWPAAKLHAATSQ